MECGCLELVSATSCSDQMRLDQSDKFSYVFAPLVGPVRLPILVEIEDQGSSIALLHRDVLTSVGTHQGGRHQGEAAAILRRLSGDWTVSQCEVNDHLPQVSLTASRNWKSSWSSSWVSSLNDKLYCRLHRRSV